MCGYDPFEPYDYQLDMEVAEEFGFATVQELYDYMSWERVNGKLQIKKEVKNEEL